MPGAIVRIARERLPDDGVVTVDAGQHKVLTSDLWQTRRPRGFHSSSGLGTMAVAIPAVLGYNAFTRVNRKLLAELDGFAHDLHAYLTVGARPDQTRS